MTYKELENKVFNFFSSDERLLNIVGISDELHYNYLLKQIYNKILNAKNIRLYEESFPTPSDIKAIQLVQYSVDSMNLNHLNQEDISLTQNPILNKKVKDAILTVLQPRLLQPFKSENVKQNFFCKEIVWLFEMLNKNFDMKQKNNILIYYGTASESDLYLLQMLYLIGFKILYINSFTDCQIGVGEKITLDTVAPMKPFKKRVAEALETLPEDSITNKNNASNKITTWAGEAKEELYNTLYDQNSIIRPWQFKTWSTTSVNFNAVIEDISTYWTEDAKLRPEFKAENGKVLVPNFMTKINGCYSDLGKYEELVNKLKSAELTEFIVETDFLKISYNSQEMYSLGFVLNSDNTVNEEKLINHSLYRLKNTNLNVQKFIIGKLNEFFEKYKSYLTTKDFVELIAIVITMEERYLRLIENFDFPFKVPKIVFYLYNRSSFDKMTANFINYLNLIGIDIVFFSPIGTESIEDCMYGETLNTIQLDEMKFDLTYEQLLKYKRNTKKKGSFFSSIFGG